MIKLLSTRIYTKIFIAAFIFGSRKVMSYLSNLRMDVWLEGAVYDSRASLYLCEKVCHCIELFYLPEFYVNARQASIMRSREGYSGRITSVAFSFLHQVC